METYIRAASIRHEKSGNNYQIDYVGYTTDIMEKFVSDCQKNCAVWGHLFNEKTGEFVASWDEVNGIT